MRFALLILALLGSSASAQQSGPFLVKETGARFDKLQDAVNAIEDGAGTIVIAPGTYKDCAVQEKGRIAFVAQTPGTSIFAGGACEGKATLVLRGRGSHVEGLTFTRIAVEDGNGAGIRIEQGNLTVLSSQFLDAQTGILSSNDPASTITIDRSTFSGLGNHSDEHGVHSIYVNDYGGLRITNSRFERGRSGHYVKNRSPRIEVLNCSFDDSGGRKTNYMIDLSNGAVGRISGNVFVVGRNKENYGTMIAVAPEGSENPSAGLVIENNKAWLTPGNPYKPDFVGSWTKEPLVIRNNALSSGITLFGER